MPAEAESEGGRGNRRGSGVRGRKGGGGNVPLQPCPGSPTSEAGGNQPASLGQPPLGLSFIQQLFTGHLLGTRLKARNNLAPGDSHLNSEKTFTAVVPGLTPQRQGRGQPMPPDNSERGPVSCHDLCRGSQQGGLCPSLSPSETAWTSSLGQLAEVAVTAPLPLSSLGLADAGATPFTLETSLTVC